MAMEDEEPSVALTSDEMLSDLRARSIRCKILLHNLSNDDNTDTAEAREQMASFNIWAANMGVFRQGRQSIVSRLKSAPDISALIGRLLAALERNLEKASQAEEEEDSSTDTGSDCPSDRSYPPYGGIQTSENDEAPPLPQSRSWTSIYHTMTSLRHLAITINRAGNQHRQERTERFKNLPRNKELYELFESCARQKVSHLFPNASVILRQRMAQSIATRRIRFLYLEQHQKKTSTLGEPTPELQPRESEPLEEESAQAAAPAEHQITTGGIAHPNRNLDPSTQPSVILSATMVTKLDMKSLQPAPNKSAESVTSVKISTGTLPSMPKLDPTGDSFTRPYCFFVCPLKEASGPSQWMDHLIHDFEPFFCISDSCSSPFSCADTYSGWLAHIREKHTKPRWHCWYCQSLSPSSGQFSILQDLEGHLADCHREEFSESLHSTIVKRSMLRDQSDLQDCPFCGGFPAELEKDYPDRKSSQVRKALEKHVRDHLVSVALILLPIISGDGSDGEYDDTQSEAQRNDSSERDLDGVGDIHGLKCSNNACDCANNSLLDWSSFEATITYSPHPELPPIRSHDDPGYKENIVIQDEWKFMRPAENQDLAHDTKLREYFKIETPEPSGVELAVNVISLCSMYARDATGAKEDIEKIQNQVTELKDALESTQDHLQGSKGGKLKDTCEASGATDDAKKLLQELHDKLSSSAGHKMSNSMGLRLLEWPFQSEDVEDMIYHIKRHKLILHEISHETAGHILVDLQFDARADMEFDPGFDPDTFNPSKGQFQPYKTELLGSGPGCRSGNSLYDVLRKCQLMPKEKVKLAYTIAQAYHHFYDSDLMRIKWTSKSIWFMPPTEENDDEISLRPYLKFHLGTQNDPEEDFIDNPKLVHQHPRIFTIGILLLEIGLLQPFQSIPKHNSIAQANCDHGIAVNLLRDLKKSTWDGFEYKSFFDNAVEYCIRKCHLLVDRQNILGRVGTNTDSSTKILLDKQLVTLMRRKKLYERVVLPLKYLAEHGFRHKTGNALGIPREPVADPWNAGLSSELSELEASFPTMNTIMPERWLKDLNSIGTTIARQQHKYKMKAIRVAVLDTGIYENEDDNISWKIMNKQDFVAKSVIEMTDTFGHGTLMARLVNTCAPSAEFIIARVARSTKDMETSQNNIKDAIIWAGKECQADIISMSFGFPKDHEGIENAIMEVQSERKGSILFLASAGNATLEYENFPARHSSVISIHAANCHGTFMETDPRLPDGSPAIWGTYGSDLPDTFFADIQEKYPNVCQTGSSIATAVAAGISATMIAYVDLLPHLEPSAQGDDRLSRLKLLRKKSGMEALFKSMVKNHDGSRTWFVDPISFWRDTSDQNPASHFTRYTNIHSCLQQVSSQQPQPDNS